MIEGPASAAWGSAAENLGFSASYNDPGTRLRLPDNPGLTDALGHSHAIAHGSQYQAVDSRLTEPPRGHVHLATQQLVPGINTTGLGTSGHIEGALFK